ncbi:MAG: glutathione S-transferase family protein [Pseudomonadota bacterium]
MSAALQLYGDSISGNCYKLQLACSELGIDYDWHEVDILAGETRTAEFLAKNPNGKIPLAVLEDGRCLAESNAILSYLADGTALAGADAWSRAEILQWMFFEQYSHEPNIATSRFIVRYLGSPPEKRAALEEKRVAGYRALDVMEQHLEQTTVFAGNTFSIADIALYAYTHVADEGGFDLAAYPAVRGWLQRIEARDRYVPMRAPDRR